MTLALIIVTTLYLLCSVTLTLMLPYTAIDPDAAFSQVCTPGFPTQQGCTGPHQHAVWIAKSD